jgi:DNA-binding CsgD family transcriptional regulator
MPARAAVAERVERICVASGPERVLRADILREIRTAVPFDAYAWVITDPVSCVGAAPLAEVPELDELPALIRLKYLTPINRWTGIPAGRAVTLVEATGGDRARSRLWREMLDGYGVHDVVSVVHHDRYGCWGFLDLWRIDPTRPSFTPPERAFLESVLPSVTRAVRTSLAATFAAATSTRPDGPVVLLLSEALLPQARTPRTDDALRALLPTPPLRSPVPAVALNVGAQLLAVEAGVDTHPPTARVHCDGRWVSVRAARLGQPVPTSGAAIAVTIELANPAERADVFSRTHGLTTREAELVRHIIAGADTRGTARALGIAEHTVNDHLKSIFAKAGTNSRRQLIAQVSG